jgi:hypothetical protein
MISSLVFITLLPLQVSPSVEASAPLSRPLAVVSFIDCARILGLPKLKLRDGNGNLYIPNKAMLHEPYAMVHLHANMPMVSELSVRKAYINSYVRR